MMMPGNRQPVRRRIMPSVPPIIFAALFGFFVPWAPGSATAAPDQSASGCCDLVYAPGAEPPWLGRVLSKLQRKRLPHIRLYQHFLFKHNNRPSYLVLIWDDWARRREQEFQVYRVRVRSPGNVRLSGLFEFSSQFLDLEPPTGVWADHDGAPLVVLSYGSGGTWYGGYGVRIFRLHKGITEVTPVGLGRPVAVEDIDGDGEFDVITSDDRWGNFYHGCGRCGPLIPLILQRMSSGYRLKCREAKSYFEELILLTTDGLKGQKADLLSYSSFEGTIGIILSRIQSGEIKRGADELSDFLVQVWAKIEERKKAGEDVSLYEKYYTKTNLEFPRVVTEAERYAATQCPLSATSAPGAHHGAIERAESFRMPATGQ